MIKIAELISGPEIAKDIKAEVAEEVSEIVRLKGVRPGLTVILVGNDPASKVYVRNKQLGCEQVGFKSEAIRMDENVSTEDLLKKIDHLNYDINVHGILVQLPLPPQVDKNRVLESIFPEKDVDGFHPMSMGKLVAQKAFAERRCRPMTQAEKSPRGRLRANPRASTPPRRQISPIAR